MEKLTKEHASLIAASLIFNDQIRSIGFVPTKEFQAFNKAIEDLRDSQAPKIATELTLEEIEIGTDILVSVDGKYWFSAPFIKYHESTMIGERIEVKREDGEGNYFEYAKVDTNAKSKHAWQINKGVIPNNVQVCAERKSGKRSYCLADRVYWKFDIEDPIKRFSYL